MGLFKRYSGKRLAAGGLFRRKSAVPEDDASREVYWASVMAEGPPAGDPGDPPDPEERDTFEASEHEHGMTDAIGHLMQEQYDRVMAGMGPINECYIEDMLGHMVPKVGFFEKVDAAKTIRRYGDYLTSNTLAERLRPGAEFYHDFWTECFMKLARPDMAADADQFMNPALVFTRLARQGKFDSLSDMEYKTVLTSVEKLAVLWHDEPFMGRSAFVRKVLQAVGIPYQKISDAAWGMEQVCLEYGSLQKAAEETAWVDELHAGPGGVRRKTAVRPDSRGGTDMTPGMIYGLLDNGVQGQDEAKRVASMVMYHHLHGHREHVVIVGPSGCGKSEIWRVLAREFPGHVRMVDTTRLSADGWRGSMHVEDIFNEISEEDLADHGLVVVLDEADKVVCERIVGGNGTDHSALVQSNLLKMMDGDVLDFNNEDRRNRPSFRADCSKVSVVMLGTFEVLLRNKSSERKGMGFGSEIRDGSKSVAAYGDVTSEDLIKAGMRREIAGRVDKIAMVRALDKSDYSVILDSFVLPGLSGMLGRGVGMTEGCKKELIDKAVDSKLGVRWMRSRVLEAMDERIFRSPETDSWEIESMDL